MNNTLEEQPIQNPLSENYSLSGVNKNNLVAGKQQVPPPSNMMGNAKPIFDPAFEKKASILAGSFDQAYANETLPNESNI